LPIPPSGPGRANTGQGAGGGAPDTGGAGIGGGGGYAGAPAGSAGYNTDILGNTRLGNGYTNPVMRNTASGGGWAGYSGRGRTPASQGKPFNPKDYLPGGRLDPKRKLAGLAGAIPDVAPVHGDIFKNISRKFYQICLRDRLYDCSTLRKQGPVGQ